MRELIRQLMLGKKIAILGFGKEGRSSYRVLRSSLPRQLISIVDDNPDILNDPELGSDNLLLFHLGKDSMKHIKEYDIVIKAPGVPTHQLPKEFDKNRIASQTSLFLKKYSSQVIGVTGTKGKSTTSSLIYHILTQAGIPSVLFGNIGLPPFEGIDNITSDTRIVMELSSHQLEYLDSSPHIAILLNIFQEHLDHYGSYEDYQQAKMNISRYQLPSDFFIFCADNQLLTKLVQQMKTNNASRLPYSLQPVDGDGIFLKEENVKIRFAQTEKILFSSHVPLNLKGEHNFANCMAAAAACYLAGVSSELIGKAISSFKGLEHRIEFVGEFGGVIYYNDSIATIPEATIEAVKTLKDVDTLILGGYDRGIDYSILYSFLKEAKLGNLIFIGVAGKRMLRELQEKYRLDSTVYEAKDYREVAEISGKVTAKGKICLLSPAASSYDMFKNFEHRGNIFKKEVRGSCPSPE